MLSLAGWSHCLLIRTVLLHLTVINAKDSLYSTHNKNSAASYFSPWTRDVILPSNTVDSFDILAPALFCGERTAFKAGSRSSIALMGANGPFFWLAIAETMFRTDVSKMSSRSCSCLYFSGSQQLLVTWFTVVSIISPEFAHTYVPLMRRKLSNVLLHGSMMFSSFTAKIKMWVEHGRAQDS